MVCNKKIEPFYKDDRNIWFTLYIFAKKVCYGNLEVVSKALHSKLFFVKALLESRALVVRIDHRDILLEQRCPTHLPLATCGKWHFKCCEWLWFWNLEKWNVFLNKFRYFQFNSHFSVKNKWKAKNRDGPGYWWSMTLVDLSKHFHF